MPLSIPAPLWTAATILVVVTTKHFIADFLLQTHWMAAGKEATRHWAVPLAIHAGCHGVLTLLIVLALAPRVWWLAPADFVVHFLIDKCKTTVGHAANLTPGDKKFWWLLGFDQYLHQLTNIAVTIAVLSA